MAPDGSSAPRRIARNTAFRVAGEIVAKLASLAFFIALARGLGESQFGDFTFALSLTTVLLMASGFGTDPLMAREVSRDRSRADHYLSNVTAVKLASSLVLLLAAAAIVNVAGYPAETRVAVYLIGAGVAIENIGKTWLSLFQAYERMEFISISLIVQRVVTAAVGLTVLALGGKLIAVSAVFAGGALVGFAAAIMALRRFIVIPKRRLEPSQWLPLVKAGVPIGIAYLLFTVLLRVDSALLGFIKGGADNSEVGVYGAAFRLIEATMFLSWAFGDAMLPWLSQHHGSSPLSLARGCELGLKVITAVLLPIGLAFTILAPQVIDLLYGHQYDAAVTPLRLLGAMTALYGINYFCGDAMIARDRPTAFSRLLAFIAPLNIVLNLALIPAYGATGAALSATLSGTVFAAFSVRQLNAVVGHLRIARVFAGPVVGGAAMAGAILVTQWPLVPAAVLGGVAYLAGLLAVEYALFGQDLTTLARFLRTRPSAAAKPKPRAQPEAPGATFEA